MVLVQCLKSNYFRTFANDSENSYVRIKFQLYCTYKSHIKGMQKVAIWELKRLTLTSDCVA